MFPDEICASFSRRAGKNQLKDHQLKRWKSDIYLLIDGSLGIRPEESDNVCLGGGEGVSTMSSWWHGMKGSDWKPAARLVMEDDDDDRLFKAFVDHPLPCGHDADAFYQLPPPLASSPTDFPFIPSRFCFSIISALYPTGELSFFVFLLLFLLSLLLSALNEPRSHFASSV